MRSASAKRGNPGASSEEADQSCGQDDRRERHAQEEDRDKGTRRKKIATKAAAATPRKTLFLSALEPTRTTA